MLLMTMLPTPLLSGQQRRHNFHRKQVRPQQDAAKQLPAPRLSDYAAGEN